MTDSKAVVILSGGMDSAVCLAIAIAERYDPHILHLTYGQRTANREYQAVKDLATHYDLNETDHVLPIVATYLRLIGGSSLTDLNIPMRETGIEDEIPLSYVPFRNGNLLAMAASWAEAIEAEAIFTGVVQEDSSGYPDCGEEFMKLFERAIAAGTRPETSIRIRTPLIHMKKSEIVRLGAELKVPFELTWSCYQQEDTPCGICDSCRLRIKAFEEAGIEDMR